MSEEGVYGADTEKPKPWWRKPLWIGAILFTIALVLALLMLPLRLVVIRVAAFLLMLGLVYYVHSRPRALWIVLGATGIGFLLMLILAFSGIARSVTDNLGAGPSLIIFFAVPLIIGALIGDWIGRRWIRTEAAALNAQG